MFLRTPTCAIDAGTSRHHRCARRSKAQCTDHSAGGPLRMRSRPAFLVQSWCSPRGPAALDPCQRPSRRMHRRSSSSSSARRLSTYYTRDGEQPFMTVLPVRQPGNCGLNGVTIGMASPWTRRRTCCSMTTCGRETRGQPGTRECIGTRSANEGP
jgi:hypothetical protein